MMTATEV